MTIQLTIIIAAPDTVKAMSQTGQYLAGHRFVDVMDAKQVVIDNAFNGVENSKTEQHSLAC